MATLVIVQSVHWWVLIILNTATSTAQLLTSHTSATCVDEINVGKEKPASYLLVALALSIHDVLCLNGEEMPSGLG